MRHSCCLWRFSVLHCPRPAVLPGNGETIVDSRSNGRGSVWMLVASMLIFGTIGVFRRYVPLPSAFLAFARGIIGGLLMLGYTRVKYRGQRMEKLPPRVLANLALTGALIGINWILLFEAYNRTTVAVATLCYYMAPTLVVLLSPLFFRERLTGIRLACALAAISGMVLVSGVIGGGPQGGDPAGVLFGLGAALFYAAVVIRNKKIRDVDAYRKTTVQLLAAGLVMVPYLLATGGFSGLDFSGAAIPLLAVMGVVHTGIAYLLYFAGMEKLSAQSVAILSYIDPVSALLFSAVLLKEPLSALNIVGALLIIGSAVISEMWKGKK